MPEKILRKVEFDPRLPHYFLLQSSFGLLVSFIGIPLLPFWLLGLGQYVHRRQFEAMEAELTERSLNVRRGFLFRTQKNVPLDKITDLAVNEGPILRKLGLCSLGVETAGGGAGTAMGNASLPGVVDALGFRDAVLSQRDIVTTGGRSAAPAPQPATEAEAGTLGEIRDSLQRIERLLEQGLAERS